MITLYLSGTILALLGVLLKIQHYNYSEPLMLAGILAAVAIIAMAVVDVWNRKEGALWQRILWTIGLVFSSSIVGLFYLLNTKKYSSRAL
jgi:drug/metabolite transporter (DMT)-like permease